MVGGARNFDMAFRRKEGGSVVRTVKAPDDRKREILDTAMSLFVEHGYENTSLRDIAKHMSITPGLVYHYFDSKQKLFDEAMSRYVEECTADYVATLRSSDLTFRQKLDVLFQEVAQEETLQYHEFFHSQGNEDLHRQLSLRLTEHLQPYLLDALKQAALREGFTVRDPETLVSFVTYGQVGIMSAPGMPHEGSLERVQEYIDALFESQVIRD